jgi:hypothetical protein
VRAALRLLLIASFLAVCALPTANMAWKLFEQTPLEGVMEEKLRPSLSLAGVAAETFQSGFTQWYEQHYGARPTFTRIDNSVLYYAFHEARPDKLVRVGKGDVIFISDHLNHWNSRRTHEFERYARRVRAAQDALRSHGVEMVFMTVPTKSTYWSDALPPAWVADLPSPRPSSVNIERRFPDELRRAGATFADGTAVLADLGARDREAIYTRPGRHLASPAACLVTEDALRQVRSRIRAKIIPTLDCSYEMRDDVGLHEEEYDLHRLLNIWIGRPAAKAPFVRFDLPEQVPVEKRPSVLVIGSSFGWKVTKELERNHAVRDLQFYYYNSTVVDWPSSKSQLLKLGSPEWRDLVASKDLLLYVVPEEYFADDNNPFFVTTIKVFGGEAAANEELVR